MKLKSLLLGAGLALSFLFGSFATQAQTQSNTDAYIEKLQTLTLRENLEMPQVDKRDHETVKTLMGRTAKTIAKDKAYKVESMRKGEVIVVTIPTDALFAPNDTLLIDGAGDKWLTVFLQYLQRPGKYKLLLAVHSDNTGSKYYTENLTAQRIEALYEWFDSKNREGAKYVFGYPMGDTQRLFENNTRANRASNRRLEIFIVPEEGFIRSIKSR